MEPLHLEKEDLLRMWSQIVTQIGVDNCSYEEWQENYEEFLKCMLPNAEPYIRILNIEQLMQMKQSQKVVPVKQINAPPKPPPISHMPVAISMLRIPRVKVEPQVAQDVKDQKEIHPDLKIIEQVDIKVERGAQETVKPDHQEQRQADEDELQQKQIEQILEVKQEPRETDRQDEQQEEPQDQQPEPEEQLQREPDLPQDPPNQLQQPVVQDHEEKQSSPKQTSSEVQPKVEKQREPSPQIQIQRQIQQNQSQKVYRPQQHHPQMRHLVHEQLHSHNLVPKHRHPFHSMQLHHHQQYQQLQHQHKIYHEQFHHGHPAHHHPAHFQHLDWRSKELQQQYPLPQNILDTQIKAYQRSLHDRPHPYDRHPYLRPSSDQLVMHSRHRSLAIESPVYERHQESSSRLSNGQFYDGRVKTEAGSENELENRLISDALYLANKINTTDDIHTNKNNVELTTNDNEAIDHWLQNYDGKASQAIEHKTTDTSDFFKNLPNLSLVVGETSQELKKVLQNEIFWDVMEEDKHDNNVRETQPAQKVILSAKQKQSESRKKKKSSK